ncbi:MAG: GNAT family N-acetyltransferase [Pseudomonadota bacterium]
MVDLSVIVPSREDAAKLAVIDRKAFPNDAVTFSADDYFGFAFVEPGVTAPAIIADADLALCVAVLRFAADEAEILTLGVVPEARRRGLGTALLAASIAIAEGCGAASIFLEVAEDNDAARALYAAAGFEEVGRRDGYYERRDGSRVAALVLRRSVEAA